MSEEDFEWEPSTVDYNLQADLEMLDELESATNEELTEIVNRLVEIIIGMNQKLIANDISMKELDKAIARLCGVSETFEEIKEMSEEKEEKSVKKDSSIFI